MLTTKPNWAKARSSVANLILLCLAAANLRAAEAIFRPGEVWLDTVGKPINAHGGGMLYHEGMYYWYGENKDGRTWLPESTKAWEGYRVDVTGIRCYSSKDLLRWQDEGLVLKAVPGDAAHDLHPSKVGERPKVVFNPRTKKFVMWLHIDSEDYKAARAGVAVADHPTGPFTYLESVRPEGQDSRDQTLFQDDDGKAYRIYSSENNDTTYISLLTDDYLKHSGKFARVFEKRRMEAPVLFKHAGKYWFMASGCTGWDPNPARSAVADSIWGPWKELGNPCRGEGAAGTFGGQSTFVFPVAGLTNAFVFMADRWNKTNLVDSRYLWLPMQFTNNQPIVASAPSWELSSLARPTVAAGAKSKSGNPIFPGWYADPEGVIYGNQCWIYPTYSAAYDQQVFFDAFSSPDLVTWTKHSRILDTNRVTWARRAMWAPAAIEHSGRYFLFFGANDIQNDQQRGGIGVAVADRPEGPFKDYLGQPLIDRFHNGAQPIDQFVFKDRDGQHYLIYGGWRHCNIARLRDDFRGFEPFPDASTFKEITPEGYVEGPFMFLKDGKYYFMWSEGGWTGPNYSVAYAIADSPLGPFKRIAKVLQQDPQVATGAGHHSVIKLPGSDTYYIVYHRRPLGERDGNHRVTCIDRMEFDEQGLIKPVKITFEGVESRLLQ
jgi:beta-xylosidase